MKVYICQYPTRKGICGFTTLSRKEIRKHLKEVHGVRAGKDSFGLRRTPLSDFYKSVDYEEWKRSKE